MMEAATTMLRLENLGRNCYFEYFSVFSELLLWIFFGILSADADSDTDTDIDTGADTGESA